MADCPEIQDNRPTDGDRLVDYVNDEAFIDVLGNHWATDGYPCETWLPHQDQIQEMMGLKLYDLLEQIRKFIDKSTWTLNKIGKDGLWGKPKKCIRFVSMEQLWLAFYMYKKYQKVWSSKEEKWVKK